MKSHYLAFLALLLMAVRVSAADSRSFNCTPSPFVATAVFHDTNGNGFCNAGDVVVYTISMTNTGSEALPDTILTPNISQAGSLPWTSIAPGETVTYSIDYVIAQWDVDNGSAFFQAGLWYMNAAGEAVQLYSDDGDPQNGIENPTIFPIDQLPQIQLVKTGAVQDAGNGTQFIPYQFFVTNTGNTTLNNVVLFDALLGVSFYPFSPSSLAPGQSTSLVVDYTVTPLDMGNGMVVNSASVSCQTPLGATVTDVSDNGNPLDGDSNPTITSLSPIPDAYMDVSASLQDTDNDQVYEAGETIQLLYSVTNSGSAILSDVHITVVPESTVVNAVPPILQPSEVTLVNGLYTLTQQDVDNGSVQFMSKLHVQAPGGETMIWSYVIVVSLAPATTIELRAFLDANNNGVKDAGEPGFSKGHFRYVVDDLPWSYNLYAQNGQASISNVSPNNNFDLYFDIDSNYAAYYTLANPSYLDVNLPANSGTVIYNFPITANAFHDLQVDLSSFSSAMPGFGYANVLHYTNNGSQVIPAGTLTFSAGGGLSLTSTSEPGAVMTSTGFTYDFSDLQPFEDRLIYVFMQVPVIPLVNLGQSLVTSVSGTISVDDAYPANNTDSVTQIVVGSFDPNDKTEKHGGQIVHSAFTADDFLAYTIRFENTGTANAQQVRVTDMLDAALDENSVRMVSASHPYVLQRVGNELTWNFNDIDLPPSVPNSQVGHGYLTFEVKPKSGYAIGDIIPNTASIYFDFNPAIVTNTFETEFVSQLGVSDPELTTLSLYPNPTNGSVSVRTKDGGNIMGVKLFDAYGKKLSDKEVNDSFAQLDLSGMAAGVYFLKVETGTAVATLKILKK